MYSALTIVLLILFLVSATLLFLQLPQFGGRMRRNRKLLLQQSPHFKNGQFHNLSHTPTLSAETSHITLVHKFFFGKNKRNIPSTTLPSKKTNLLNLDPSKDVFVWFGHSSYFMQINGKTILVDPVLSGYASPVSFAVNSFRGSDVYTVADLPAIDYLFITHDHYDHMDHRTLTALKTKVGKVITGLGVGAHLERWGYNEEQIIEKDWNENVDLDDGFQVYTAPARHCSGRTFKRNGTLWLSFVLYTPKYKLFLGGDSGYDDHFKKIGEQHGPFDFAILENGQYDKSWKCIHMTPEETVAAAIDLKAKKLLPVHWAKFSLSLHAWDDPIVSIQREAIVKSISLVHPMIGEPVHLKEPVSSAWWVGID